MSTPSSPAPPQQRPRPTEDEILEQWQNYFGDPLLSLEGLRREAEAGELERKRGLRSLGWRFFFSLLPSPSPTDSSPASSASLYSTYSLLLAHSRSQYTNLRERYLRSPDGGWVKDGPTSSASDLGSSAGSNGAGEKEKGKGAKAPLEKVDVRHNNPLGLEEENPWTAWFADLELRKTIRQDVQRTFPEVDYFRLPATQDRLTDLLFIWCKLHPSIGYRQGMHELLAPFLWVVDYDSLSSSSSPNKNSLPHLVLAGEWVEHDTWQLFAALMRAAQVYYDHQPSVALSPKPAPAFPPTASSSAPAGGSSSTLVQPIVSIAAHLQSLLSTVDPPLHSAFTTHQVEPQLYLIRWLRLLFSREFPLPDTLTLWDGLFARDPSLQLTTHVALAMLLRVRDALVGAAKEGYGEFLHVLLRYPSCSDGSFHSQLLLKQALYLRDNLSRTGAEYVRRQNASLGASVGEPQLDGADELGSGFSSASSSSGARNAHGQHRRTASAAPGTQQPQGLGLFGKGLVGDLAKGVYGRAEALGINKAITGAFNDIKRDFAEAQAQIEEQRRLRASGMSQIPPYLPWEAPSPTPPPPAAKDALSDLAKMRASSIAMSAAIDLCVAVLERELVPPTPDLGRGVDGEEEEEEEGSGGGTKPGDIPLSQSRRNGGSSAPEQGGGAGKGGAADAKQPTPQGKKPPPHLGAQTMALTALKHVRDVLGGQAQVFDESVLEPLKQVLGSEAPSPPPSRPLPFSSPPLPPLPAAESPQPSPTPQLAVSPPRAARASAPSPSAALPPPSAPQPAPPPVAAHTPPTSTAAVEVAPSPSPSLLLGSRSEKPSAGLFRTPQPRQPSNPLLGPPSPSLYPPQPRPSAASQHPASAPPSTPAPPPQPSNPAFPAAGFSTRPASQAGNGGGAGGRREPSSDPLGAL
ncbi:hypothetical protein JCM6882_006894 [Rhodosporidiobolus microsporus]